MRERFLYGVWRTLIFLLGLVVALAGLYVLLHAAGVAPPLYYSTSSGAVAVQDRVLVLGFNLNTQPTYIGLRWIGGGMLAILLGLALMALAAARARGTGRRVVLRGHGDTGGYGGGRLTVSMRSLQALVTRVAERTEGVREADPRLRLQRKGWRVDCNLALAPTASLPEVAQTLKARVQEALEHHTGLPVERVDITGRLGLKDAHRRVR